MKYSQLAVFLSLLVATYGPIDSLSATEFQEDCCGHGNLTAGVRMFRMAAARRDVSKLNFKLHYAYSLSIKLRGIIETNCFARFWGCHC